MNQQPKHDKATQDNRSNQMNPEHPAYHRGRGESPGQAQQSAQQVRESHQHTSEPGGGGKSSGTDQR